MGENYRYADGTTKIVKLSTGPTPTTGRSYPNLPELAYLCEFLFKLMV
jgi:hypothetical protein